MLKINAGRDVFIFQPLGQSPRQEWMPRPDLTQEPEIWRLGLTPIIFLIIALTSIRATICTISSNTMESIYMNKMYENNDNSEKMLNDILSNALLYLHETPFSFASSAYVISFQSLIKMLCNNILKHILCPGHVTDVLYNQLLNTNRNLRLIKQLLAPCLLFTHTDIKHLKYSFIIFRNAIQVTTSLAAKSKTWRQCDRKIFQQKWQYQNCVK